jgi:anaerobic magnesium-protoporphyrin IX monomethyl ester cyclase
MQITLVKPCWRYPITGADHTYNRRWPPLELLNCAALLNADGHQVRIVDAQAENLPPEAVAQRVGDAEMIVLSTSALDRWQCPTLELEPVKALARQLRPKTKRLYVCGFHGTVQPEPMLRMTGADAVIRGEPELTVRELATGQELGDTAGLTFLRQGGVVSTPDRRPLDMTSLPVPAFELIDPKHYCYEILGSRFMVLEGVRGCPYPCSFCSRVMQGRQLRRKTVEQLGREVRTATERFGVRNIYFIDLEFTASREMAEGISKFIIDNQISVRWCCQTRADKVDGPLLELMRRAGCRLIHLGVETASPRIAQLTNKGLTIEQQIAAVEMAKRAGMETLCFFLLGYPGESEEEMRETIRLAKRMNPTYAAFHRISPYAGTPLFDQIQSDTDELFPVFAGSEEDRRKVDRLVRRAIWSYYMRPGYIFSRLLRGSPASLWRQLRLFAGYFR